MNDKNEKHELPALGANAADRAAAVLRSILGAFPVVGPALAEIITEIVPNQRIERLEKYLLYLQEELARLSPANLEERLRAPAAIDLIEDGAYQAVRALSDERQRYIARCVAGGIAADDLNHIREKRMLGILSQLDDEEILILEAYGSELRDMPDKFRKLIPDRPHINSDRQIRETYALYEAATAKLERLSLVCNRIRFNREAEKKLGLGIPEFDHFSGEAEGHEEITSLGRLVLRKIGLLAESAE